MTSTHAVAYSVVKVSTTSELHTACLIYIFSIISHYCECRNFRAVHMFALFAFKNVRENMCNVKITFIMPFRGNILKNANINPREIVIHAKISTFTVY